MNDQDNLKNNELDFSKLDVSNSQPLSLECKEHFQNWMHNISTTVIPENATLVVDWSELDKLLMEKSCPYDQLWIELWRVNEDNMPNNNDIINKNQENGQKEIFGTPEYFLKYERCNKLDESLFAYHSTRSHDRRPKRIQTDNETKLKQKEVEERMHLSENGKSVYDEPRGDLVAFSKLDSSYSTKTTFLHVVENSYILRLCPCGKVRKHRRVCDCEYTSALCSGVINIEQPTRLQVFDWCNTNVNTKGLL